jgi:NAD(P)-dependent dehydrogenase (short-subunit alcohol dehydrogenase family)
MDVFVITGGSRDIGAAAAPASANRSLGVILTYNSHSEAAEAARRVFAGEARPGFQTR